MIPLILNSIKTRLDTEISPRNPVKFLKKEEPEKYINDLIAIIYLYTRPKKGQKNPSIYFSEIVSAIGHTVRSTLKQKQDSGLAAKTGGFLLYTFQELGLLKVKIGRGANNHQAYIIEVLNDDAIVKLWTDLPVEDAKKLPSETPYAAWTSTKHANGANMVKTQNKAVLKELTPETHPIVFSCINRAQTVGWRINEDIFKLYSWALRNKTDAFSDIWDQQSAEAKATKVREAKAIGEIAKRFIGKTFYHLYYFDFRGRKYPTTAYLHEQGSDLARGLLIRADKKAIGKEGFFWLLVSIASNWAGSSGRDDGAKTDKIPLKDRYLWVLDNEEIILSYAENPKVNQGWMKADSPWQFLAACIELMQLRIYQSKKRDYEDFSYESHLECYIDGSNNGSQHLSALTRDEITAPHVNLVPLDLPGDLYKYVADNVWNHLRELTQMFEKDEVNAAEKLIDNILELKKAINEAEPRSDKRAELIAQIQKLKLENSVLMNIAGPLFWLRITDNKHKRKIVKRNTMTLPYGGTPYGLGQQQIDDAKKHGIDLLLYMEHKWGSFLGREVFANCKYSLKRPMQLLSVFEQAGKKAEEEKRFLSWHVPVTNFPVVQNYVEGTTKKFWVQYGPPEGEQLNTGYYANTFQIAISCLELPVPSKGKQSQGASPNAIHSLDAAHLAMIVAKCPFEITTIHDSFGCLLADMPDLFRIARETFVELYKADPLNVLMKEIEGDLTNVEFGTLDIEQVLESEYCFC